MPPHSSGNAIASRADPALRPDRLAYEATLDASAAAQVSAVAWVFIVLAAFALLACAAESVVIAVMFPSGTRVLAQADHFGDFGRFVLGHLQPLLLALQLIFAITLVAAIGLLMRANWARRAFIGLMVFGIYWNVGGAILVWYFLYPAPDPGIAPQVAHAQLDVLRNLALTFDLLLSAASAALFGWIIKRLRSPRLRREFDGGRS